MPSRLLVIPREIRDLIYEYVLVRDVILIERAAATVPESAIIRSPEFYKRFAQSYPLTRKRVHRRVWLIPRFDLGLPCYKDDPELPPSAVQMTYQLNSQCDLSHQDRIEINVLQTCQQIYHEAREIFYNKNVFRFKAAESIATTFAFLCDRPAESLKLISSIEMTLDEGTNLRGTDEAHYPVVARSTDSVVLRYAYNHFTELCTLLSTSRVRLRKLSLFIHSSNQFYRPVFPSPLEYGKWEAQRMARPRPWVASWVYPLLKLENLECLEIHWKLDRPEICRIADTLALMRQQMLVQTGTERRGPLLARFSKFYGIYAGVLPTKLQYFKWQQQLHHKYQVDVIRTGPREVTVYCADAIPLIHGPTSKCRKPPCLYGLFGKAAGHSLQTTSDKAEHRQRRKVWDRAFNAKALREYEPRLNRHALALMSKLKEQSMHGPVRINKWLNFYSFDVMGDIGFNHNFGMVSKGKEAAPIKLLHDSTSLLTLFSHIPWALNLVMRIPICAKRLHEHMEWSRKVLEHRIKNTPKENDVFSWLLNKDVNRVTPDMNSDSRLLIIAGSDTVAASMSFLVYELCTHPEIQSKLRDTIGAIKPEKSHLEVSDLAEFPSGPPRETPPEGITLPNGTYIPGNVLVWTPIYSFHRDPRYWEQPLKFMPERWTTENPNAIIDKRTFLTFITGAYNCIGQKLAITEMRSIVANLVRSFEITFADGEDGSTIENKSQDCFTVTVGKLDVNLTPRRV
ncbi:uncharacterized protein yc1106_00360 [Curvularia clavata]|uniref:DUF7730 domain-containing protein n=1 Tax=Curvularia clavata TaxID=95742 RepID=A0A9Q9DP99_CURCL|nr:uncharacterized protein yc1106_00360 [Curvularia clavata]